MTTVEIYGTKFKNQSVRTFMRRLDTVKSKYVRAATVSYDIRQQEKFIKKRVLNMIPYLTATLPIQKL